MSTLASVKRYRVSNRKEEPNMKSGLIIGLLRIAQLILWIIFAVLVASGTGCTTDAAIFHVEACADDLNIQKWADAREGNQPIKGQFVVFIIAILLALIAGVMALLRFKSGSGRKILQMAVCIVGLVISILFGSIEIWYGSGFGNNDLIFHQTIKGWYAAAAVAFFTAIFYVADVVFCWRLSDD